MSPVCTPLKGEGVGIGDGKRRSGMAVIRCPECGREYQSRSGLRRHMKSVHGQKQAEGADAPPSTHSGRGFDTTAARPTQDAEGVASFDTSFDTGSALLRTTQDVARDVAQDARPEAATGPVEQALVDLGIEWKDVMAFRVHSDRVVIVEGPVGFKRTWWLSAGRAAGKSEG
jgi:hypothetical protein